MSIVFKTELHSRLTLESLMPKTMKLLGSTEEKITKGKYCENVPHLENNLEVLAHCNIVNNKHQHDSCILSTFIPNKKFSELLKVSHAKHNYTETFRLEVLYIDLLIKVLNL